MKPFNPRAVELAAPKQQRNWDWRAAANFICGGAGGGLLLVAAFAGLDAFATRAALLMGLALIGCGLTCVWFEIGRPWRAMNVYRHFATSWMTREAVVALVVFATGALAIITASVVLTLVAGACGAAFLYSQARILAANKGIPAWRHPASVPLMVSTGLAEGAGFAASVAALAGAGPDTKLLVLLLVLLAVRVWCWRRYLAGLTRSGAPLAALKVLDAFGPRFQTIGHGLPAVVLVAALVGLPGRSLMVLLAGLLVAASGWVMKYTLVRRAAYTQGLAVDHLPVRGRGPSGPAAKPGWKMMSGGNRG
jgi:phenylacetyl-CoA:acceptor oxidoreductase subunit 2